MPALKLKQQGKYCVMDDSKVRLVNLKSSWDYADKLLNAYQYPCNANVEENINGAFSPMNDAYYFGHVIIDMYKKWYDLYALQTTEGAPRNLIMRVHFGKKFDNAFWDGIAMSFGDGDDFYPLVALDIAGHEVTHGFTEQHSGLEYHDESGAINESMSDMAAQASRAYLLNVKPDLFNKTNIKLNEVTWGIGETIVKDSLGSEALRFMDQPSTDGNSADCLDKSLAHTSGSKCSINYKDVVAFADANIFDPRDKQSYIVHTASGIFNKVFYLLAKEIGIKKAYNVMVIANTNYWMPLSDFKSAACGVLFAANDLKMDINIFKKAFNQVGVETEKCLTNLT